MSNTENVKLGVCNVSFDGNDLGYTQGGVEVAVASTTHEVKVDQFGDSPVNEYIMGRTCTAKVPLAETTLENLVRIMPGATLSQTGGAKASGTVTFVTAPPVDGDKVTVNGVDFTFKTSPVGANDIAIPGTIAAAATALAAKINASTNPAITVGAVAAAGAVTLTADSFGVAGNAVTLAKTAVTSANLTVSGATLTGGTAPTKVAVKVTNAIGTSLLASAKKLVLHPVALPPEDTSEDFIIPLANTAGALQFSFKLDQERLFPVDFKAYPDPVTKTLFIVGDETAAA
jgi:hypothetical protein